MRGEYLKAHLDEAGIAFSKTHGLKILLTLLVQLDPGWNALLAQVNALTGYAVDFRYPGKSATKAEAKQAITDCREIRRAARIAFGLPV
jgi:HEPN domain-containing protein